ncbi:DTW domain containing protein [Nonlabens ulvanivorans]|uniref:tRNA-uridine aminocarboxypropyltransferase n=1 Tax=Nonlabens ulvanivorans TaxID=906888 RepID=A0A090X3L3_NONUL|nr:DTW domain containing protein [Nonlabens ulvanivorans]
MHPKEYKKQKNGTGHMTNLQLENAEIIVGVDFNKHQRVNEILADQNNASFLLYPGKKSFNLSTSNDTEINDFMGQRPYLFILDGTWPSPVKCLN